MLIAGTFDKSRYTAVNSAVEERRRIKFLLMQPSDRRFCAKKEGQIAGRPSSKKLVPNDLELIRVN
jgi:hypothetical protein